MLDSSHVVVGNSSLNFNEEGERMGLPRCGGGAGGCSQVWGGWHPPNSPLFPLPAFCRQIVPEGYQDYCFPNLTSSGFYRISNCTPAPPAPPTATRGSASSP